MKNDPSTADLLATDAQRFDEIAEVISSDESPVGIDAKKTHVLILSALADIQRRLGHIEARLGLEEK